MGAGPNTAKERAGARVTGGPNLHGILELGRFPGSFPLDVVCLPRSMTSSAPAWTPKAPRRTQRPLRPSDLELTVARSIQALDAFIEQQRQALARTQSDLGRLRSLQQETAARPDSSLRKVRDTSQLANCG